MRALRTGRVLPERSMMLRPVSKGRNETRTGRSKLWSRAAVALLLSGLFAGPAIAADVLDATDVQSLSSVTERLPSVAEEMLRYLVVVNGEEPDFASLGATVESSEDDRRLVRMPASAVDALAQQTTVAYLQLVTEPGDPRPGATAGDSDTAALPLAASSEAGTSWTTGSYLYDGSGNIKSIGPDSYGQTQAYAYDRVLRLVSGTAHTQDATHVESYSYDEYGNMSSKTTDVAPRDTSMAADPATNKITGNVKYDDDGHLIWRNTLEHFVWDGAGALSNYHEASYNPGVTQPPANITYHSRYLYTPDDERIGVLHGDASGTWSWTLRDFGGKVIREYSSSIDGGTWTWVEDYAHGGGRLLTSEREAAKGGRRHYLADHLGTTRVVTNESRARISEHVFFPFGQEATSLVQETNGRQSRLKYTGHERDYMAGEAAENKNYLDYMHARYYNPNLGRFLSVDPAMDAKRLLRSPQGWNRYAYVKNNPLTFVDPKGLLEYRASVLGAVVDVHIDDSLDMKKQLELKAKLDSGFKKINAGKGTLSEGEQNIVRLIKSLDVGNFDSGVNTITKEFRYSTTSLEQRTPDLFALDYFHDNKHIVNSSGLSSVYRQWFEGGRRTSFNELDEQDATEFAIGAGVKLPIEDEALKTYQLLLIPSICNHQWWGD